MKVPSGYLGIKKPRIEMLPLIDIVFLLLIFFIYAMLSMAVHRSLPVSLPVSSTAAINTELNLTVTVRQNGEIFLDHTEVSLEELQAVLQDKAQKATDGKTVQVDLFADEALSYQELYRILDIIRTAGISNVSLQAGGLK
jgi:biopolymer transport protein ExbD